MSTLTISALGRIGMIGDLYDARKDQFCGCNIFTCILPSSTFQTVDNPSTDLEFVTSDSYEEKFSKLKVNAELKLSILAGLFSLEGSGKYLSDKKSSNRAVTTSLIYKITTKTEKLNIYDMGLKKFFALDSLKAEVPTHFVTEINWGANAILTAECMTRSNENQLAIEGMLKACMNKIKFVISAKAAAEAEFNEEEKQNQSKFTIKLFGDIVSGDQLPQTIEDALAYMKQLPVKIQSANNGKGKPISYILLPIAFLKNYLSLDTASDTLVKTIQESAIQRCIHFFDKITVAKQQLHDLYQDTLSYPYCISKKEKSAVELYRIEQQIYETEVRAALARGLVEVRTGVKENLDEILMKFEDHKYSPNNIDAFFTSTAAGIFHSIEFAQIMEAEGVLFANGLQQLDNILIKDPEAYVLFMDTEYKNNNPKLWNSVRGTFLGLLRNSKKQTGRPKKFCIVHCGASGIQNHSLKISHYENGKCINENLADWNFNNSTIALAQPYEGFSICNVRPNKRAPLELPCPMAFKGSCHNEPLNWSCSKCQNPLEFGFDDYLYCKCGKGKASQFLFKCPDIENHGIDYEIYELSCLNQGLSKMRPNKEVNILILGETGVGKSTWINGFANYLTYQTLKDATAGESVNLIATKFSMTDEHGKAIEVRTLGSNDSNENYKTGESATQFPKSYVFPRGDALIRVIDTPGIGDTRGLEQDKKNFQNIMSHISHFDELHGICILLKPNNARLNIMFEFCIKELLTHLHKDAAKNIIFCFTNARSTFYRPGDTRPSLEKLLKENKDVEISLTNNTMYCLDNESVRFLAAVKSGVTFDDMDKETYAASWRNSMEETERLFQHISQLSPHKTTETVTLNKARSLILALTEPIGQISKNIQDNIAINKEHMTEIKKSLEQKSGYEKKLYIPAIDIEFVDVDYPTTVCTASKCITVHKIDGVNKTTFKQKCHEKCQLSNIEKNTYPSPGLKNCWAMSPSRGSHCRICSCPWETHMHITYEIKQKSTKVIDQSMQEMLDATTSRVEKVQIILDKNKERIEKLEKEQKRILQVSQLFAAFLKANAIAPYNDALLGYLNCLLKLEREKAPHLQSDKSVTRLEELLRTYSKEIEVLKDAVEKGQKTNVLQPKDIDALVKELYHLPIHGKQLENLVKGVSSAMDKNALFNEQLYMAPNNTQGKRYQGPQTSSSTVQNHGNEIIKKNWWKFW